MDIGKEEEAIEVPIPLAPSRQPIHEPSPEVAPAEPVKEPAHAWAQRVLDGEMSLTDWQEKVIDKIMAKYNG